MADDGERQVALDAWQAIEAATGSPEALAEMKQLLQQAATRGEIGRCMIVLGALERFGRETRDLSLMVWLDETAVAISEIIGERFPMADAG